MKLDFYQIDAFTDTLFGGNPAVVVPLKEWLPDALLLKITQENAVAETAFFVDKGEKMTNSKFALDSENSTQFAKILSKKIWPNRQVLNVKHDTHPETGKAHVMIMSPHPLEKVEQEIKKFM